MSLPSVAIIVPIRNELPRLAALLDGIEHQTLRPSEVVVADGMSTDGSRAFLEHESKTRAWLSVIDNPDITIPHALNRAFRATSAQIVARMDAHADYSADYLEKLATLLSARPEVAGAGGWMQTSGTGASGRAIATVLRRSWGLGGAPHRVAGAAGPTDHVFCTAYRRQAVVAAGGWDLGLLANEDAELDYRVGRIAGPIFLEPAAHSTWYTRTRLGALGRQMFRYGFYRARTVHLHPGSLRSRHLAPVALIVTLVALLGWRPSKGAACTAAYLGSAAAAGAYAAHQDGSSGWRAAAAVPIVHLSWGSGFLAGLVLHFGAAPRPGLAAVDHSPEPA
jgi:glycosyltransferase involved in cell wall biosynthesis